MNRSKQRPIRRASSHERVYRKISEKRAIYPKLRNPTPDERRCRHRRRTMRCRLAKPNRQLMWRIWALALIISIVFVFGSTAVFARGGGHSGGGHAGGHSGGLGSHSGGHEGHHGDHTGGKHGFSRSGATAGRKLIDKRPRPHIRKNVWASTPPGGTQRATDTRAKTRNRVETRVSKPH